MNHVGIFADLAFYYFHVMSFDKCERSKFDDTFMRQYVSFVSSGSGTKEIVSR